MLQQTFFWPFWDASCAGTVCTSEESLPQLRSVLSYILQGRGSSSNSVVVTQVSVLGRKSVVLSVRNTDPWDTAFISVWSQPAGQAKYTANIFISCEIYL